MKKIFDKEKLEKIPWIAVAIALLAIIAIAVTAVVHSDARGGNGKEEGRVVFLGEYRIDGGDWMPLDEDTRIGSHSGDVFLQGYFFTSTDDGLEPVRAGEAIYLFLDHVSVTVTDSRGVWYSRTEREDGGKDACAKTLEKYVTNGEKVTVKITNPHSFGNARATDRFLRNMTLYREGSGGILATVGVVPILIVIILIAFLVVLLGISLFLPLLRRRYNREIRLVWLLVFFGVIYFIFKNDNIGILNPNNAVNTMALGASMMLYITTITAIVSCFLKSRLRLVAMIETVAVGLGALLSILASLHPDFVIYDAYPAFVLLSSATSLSLTVMLAIELVSLRAEKDKDGVGDQIRSDILSIAVLVAYLLDALATLLGIWQGGLISLCMLLTVVIVSVVIMRSGFKKSVKTLLEAKSIQEERQAMERKLQESQISIMLSQIQPHFLYNTLNSIYQLCETNPMRARSMVNSFSEYLRNNLSSLEEQGLISFETELSHVKTYLDIEKVRFEDTLEIEYDIKCADFSLPVLTVQPIVENAVKHGTSKKRGGGKVTISAFEERDHYVITVADTGKGFDPSRPKTDGKRHVGIENVRQRLLNMCSGSLSIESEIDVGTIATIRIPKGGKK